MQNRILNFSEFFEKYSKPENKENSIDTVTKSYSNFEDGFDETTYDKTELGPNKPISGDIEATPVPPTSYNPEKDETMEAPSEEEETEGEEETTDDDETKDEEEKEEPNPEAENEKVSESKILNFKKFTNYER